MCIKLYIFHYQDNKFILSSLPRIFHIHYENSDTFFKRANPLTVQINDLLGRENSTIRKLYCSRNG